MGALQVNVASASGDYVTCIDLEKTGPETAGPGETITYHFWVKNCGDIAFRAGAQVYDPLFGSDHIWSGVLYPGDVAEFDKEYTLPDDKCGDFINPAWAIGHPLHPDGYYLPDVRDDDSWTVDIICGPPPGTGTPGYWKTHPDAWPVEEITVGGVTYLKDEAIAYMWMPRKGDETFTMFSALVAAKLNVLVGNDAPCIEDTIAAADDWMADYGPVGSGVKGNSDAWQEGEPLYFDLDDYNNGLLCAPSRDALE